MCNHEALACRVDMACNMCVCIREGVHLRRGGTNDQSFFLRLDGIQYLLPGGLRLCSKSLPGCSIVVASFRSGWVCREILICTEAEKAGLNEHRLSGEMHSE